MRITELRELTVPLEGAIENAVVSFAGHTVSMVEMRTDVIRGGRPVSGIAFNSIGRFGQAGILRERFFPRVLAAAPESLLAADGRSFSAAALVAVAMKGEKPGGHGDRAIALGALELALWDLNAKLAGEPAWSTIARHVGHLVTDHSAPVYAAGGYYYPDDSLSRLRGEFEHYRALGFAAFKMKVGGATTDDDLRRIDTALEVAGGSRHIAVDANGRFGRDAALAFAERIAPLDLGWFEEPGDPLDYALQAELADAYPGVLATGENLFGFADVRNLVRHGGMRPGRDLFQMDPGLCYGLTEYLRMLAFLEATGHDRRQCFPHGGHLINLHVVIGLGLGGCEAYPGVFQPFGGYPAGCTLEGGRVRVPDWPGFGLEYKPELQDAVRQLTA